MKQKNSITKLKNGGFPPFFDFLKKIKKDLKKVLTNTKGYDNIYKLSRTVSQTNENKSLDLVKIRIASFRFRKPLQKILKNLLTNTKQCDMIYKLSDDSQAK